MRNGLIVLTLWIAILSSGCGAERRTLEGGRLRQTLTSTSDARFIRVLGVGVSPPGTENDTLRKALARNAALVSARFELAGFLKGVRLEGGLTVQRAVETDSRIRASMDQVIAGAEEESVEFTNDGGAAVIVRIERSKIEDMLSAAAKAEATAIDRASFEEQLRLADGRSREMRARLSGMGE